MLRDLRITTAKVESRRGDEQVTLLGELAVDERAYAEVGVPVAARVIRLLAGVGDTVKEGQALLELQSTEVGRARADYLTAVAHLTLAESALTRKRDLAAERIAPQREVQEAEADCDGGARGRARGDSGAERDGPAHAGDGEAETSGRRSSRCTSPVRGHGHRATGHARADAGSRHGGVPCGRPLDAVADRARLRARRGAGSAGDAGARHLLGPARPGVHRERDDGRPAGLHRVADDRRAHRRAQSKASCCDPACRHRRPCPSASATRRFWPFPLRPCSASATAGASSFRRERACSRFGKIGRGRDLGTEVEVLSGVSAGETIVVDGAFLLKSQAEKSDAGHGDH